MPATVNKNGLILYRRGFGHWGTAGELWTADGFHCYTVELPWRDNERNVSCIPEGAYAVKQRLGSKKLLSMGITQGWQIDNVPGRGHILLHPGNFQRDTQGCILPTSDIRVDQRNGVSGGHSRTAYNSLDEYIAKLDNPVIIITRQDDKWIF